MKLWLVLEKQNILGEGKKWNIAGREGPDSSAFSQRDADVDEEEWENDMVTRELSKVGKVGTRGNIVVFVTCDLT